MQDITVDLYAPPWAYIRDKSQNKRFIIFSEQLIGSKLSKIFYMILTLIYFDLRRETTGRTFAHAEAFISYFYTTFFIPSYNIKKKK